MTWSVSLLLLPLVCCYILRNILTCGSYILRWMIWDHMSYVQWLFSLNCLLHQHIMLFRFYMSWSRCSRFAWLLIICRFSRRDFVPPQNDVCAVWHRPSSEWRMCRLTLSLLRMTCVPFGIVPPQNDVCAVWHRPCWTSLRGARRATWQSKGLRERSSGVFVRYCVK